MAASSKEDETRFRSKGRDDHSEDAELLPVILIKDLEIFLV